MAAVFTKTSTDERLINVNMDHTTDSTYSFFVEFESFTLSSPSDASCLLGIDVELSLSPLGPSENCCRLGLEVIHSKVGYHFHKNPLLSQDFFYLPLHQ